jgi:hypothetical protein
MNAADHYLEAERLVELADSPAGRVMIADGFDIVGQAQVHATLAQAAATLQPPALRLTAVETVYSFILEHDGSTIRQIHHGVRPLQDGVVGAALKMLVQDGHVTRDMLGDSREWHHHAAGGAR